MGVRPLRICIHPECCAQRQSPAATNSSLLRKTQNSNTGTFPKTINNMTYAVYIDSTTSLPKIDVQSQTCPPATLIIVPTPPQRNTPGILLLLSLCITTCHALYLWQSISRPTQASLHNRPRTLVIRAHISANLINDTLRCHPHFYISRLALRRMYQFCKHDKIGVSTSALVYSITQRALKNPRQ